MRNERSEQFFQPVAMCGWEYVMQTFSLGLSLEISYLLGASLYR